MKYIKIFLYFFLINTLNCFGVVFKNNSSNPHVITIHREGERKKEEASKIKFLLKKDQMKVLTEDPTYFFKHLEICFVKDEQIVCTDKFNISKVDSGSRSAFLLYGDLDEAACQKKIDEIPKDSEDKINQLKSGNSKNCIIKVFSKNIKKFLEIKQ